MATSHQQNGAAAILGGSKTPNGFLAAPRPNVRLSAHPGARHRQQGPQPAFKNSGGGLNVTAETLSVAPDADSVDLVLGHELLRLITFQVKPEIYQPAKSGN